MRDRRTGWARRALAAIVVVLLAAAALGLVALLRGSRAAEPGPDADGCNGDVQLCDRRLDQVALAGSHNAMAVAGEPGWFLPEQRKTLAEQLDAGIRALLLDVYPGYRKNDLVRTDLRQPVTAAAAEADVSPAGRAILGRLGVSVGALPPDGAGIEAYLCHAYCELGASDMVEQMGAVADFLSAHPDEVVLLILQDYVPAAETEQVFKDAGLLQHVWPLAPGEPLPTLREMINTRHNVVVLSENHGGEVPWMPAAIDVMEETPYEFASPSDFSCAPNRGGTGKPLFLLNHWLDYTGRPSALKAAPVNTRASIDRRLAQCRRDRGRAPGIVAVDFSDTGDVLRVVGALNRAAQVGH